MLTQRELPAIELAATLVHVGPVSEIHQSYAALALWLEQNQWQLISVGRQVFMQLPLRGGTQEEESVVELQMPIRRASETDKFGA